MGNSSTGGFIAPTDPIGPLEDDDFDDFFQAIVTGITGLPGSLVRPRFQEEPPTIPSRTTDWCAIGVTRRAADTFAVEGHDGAGDGSDYLIRHEALDLLCSFYGPHAQAFGARLRDGFSIAQNMEPLLANGMGLVSLGDLTRAPELIKDRWLNRTDLPVVIRREIRRTYPVLNLTSATVELTSETVTAEVAVNP
jgi:hypothetical protein